MGQQDCVQSLFLLDIPEHDHLQPPSSLNGPARWAWASLGTCRQGGVEAGKMVLAQQGSATIWGGDATVGGTVPAGQLRWGPVPDAHMHS